MEKNSRDRIKNIFLLPQLFFQTRIEYFFNISYFSRDINIDEICFFEKNVRVTAEIVPL